MLSQHCIFTFDEFQRVTVVNISEKRLEGQVQFWSLLGPLLILLGIAILLFKISGHWYLPMGVLVGVPLCVKWKMNGLAMALTFLFALFLASYQQIEFRERYWHLGMGMAMALSFVILTLSLEEIKNLIDKLQAESQSRLDNFLRLDEDVKNYERTWSLEKESFTSHIQILSNDVKQTRDEGLTFQKLVYLARDELIALRGQHELLLEDLVYKRRNIVELNERIEQNEMTIETFVNTDSIKEVKTLTLQLEESDARVELLKKRVAALEQELGKIASDHTKVEKDLREDLLRSQQEREQLSQSSEGLAFELKEVHQSLKQKSGILEQTVMELSLARNQIESSDKALDLLKSQLLEKESFQKISVDVISPEQSADKSESREKSLDLPCSQVHLIESMYRQLKDQFREKNIALTDTRRELFYAKEQILAMEKDRDECQYSLPSKSEILLQKDFGRLIEEMEGAERQSREEIDGLCSVVESLLKQIAFTASNVSNS
jgi:hypothetical protein